MSDWKIRLKTLEGILTEGDPRPKISAYHDMPYAIFQYPPEVEFALRQEISGLKTRLENSGKGVTIISLADCLQAALEKEGISSEEISNLEQEVGLKLIVDQVLNILSQLQKLDDLVVERVPEGKNPLEHILFITRAGALFPYYRTSALLEQMEGQIKLPTILFYPGELEGTSGLRFMGDCDPDNNYRPRIF